MCADFSSKPNLLTHYIKNDLQPFERKIINQVFKKISYKVVFKILKDPIPHYLTNDVINWLQLSLYECVDLLQERYQVSIIIIIHGRRQDEI